MVSKIVSGGQTGVDRAALDAAMAAGVPVGGWCPRGRLAEDGPIPERYPLTETEGIDYAGRTERNVRDSDATLILARGAPTGGGTELTAALALEMGRPHLVVDLARRPDAAAVAAWVKETAPGVLNVAGPRQSTAPGIYEEAHDFLAAVLALIRRRP